MAPRLPDADRPAHATSDGQTRDLPGSDAIPLHVMWPLTPAGRQHLACRCRTCCLRANENPRPLRCLIFRGSIPHPMQSLCTLRNLLSPVATQHSLPSGRYSLLGPVFHRLDRTSFAWRTHLITSSARARSLSGTSIPSALAACRYWSM